MRDVDKSVTVVAPAYNHEQYIEQCMWSIANQNCELMELIILDDCSSDRTSEIVKEIILLDEFQNAFKLGVRFIQHTENKGARYTINEGLMMAGGEYLAVINTDDAFGPGHLQRLLNACEKEGSEFAFGGVEVVDQFNQRITTGYGKAIMKYQDTLKMCPTVTMALTRGNGTISTGNMLFSAELYRKLGGFRNYKYVHDWDFALRAALLTEPAYEPEGKYMYRLHNSNTISEIADHPNAANAVEQNDTYSKDAENPLISFLTKVLRQEYSNAQIPSVEVWEYFFHNKKYYEDDYDARWAWARAKQLVDEKRTVYE